jgi:nitric oxide reductase activation protein
MSKERDRKVADKIIKSVKKEVTYLRSRLRTVIRSMEMVHPVHGVPKGHGLSSKFLVDSKISLMQKQNPSRAYWRRGLAIDTSMAVVVVLDESGSMGTWRKDASRILVALTEPFDALNFATMAIGFRNGQFNYDIDYADYKAGNYHRNSGITYDIFKTWTERFSAIKHRFANTRATGGTPMADGIQLALNAINKRDEAHRFIFVVTDGSPDGGHVPIIRHQIKQAKEAGIHIIGVGMGGSAREVKTLYPDYVHSDNIAEIPKLLLDKLNELADFGEHRSKRVKNLQKIGKKGF